MYWSICLLIIYRRMFPWNTLSIWTFRCWSHPITPLSAASFIYSQSGPITLHRFLSLSAAPYHFLPLPAPSHSTVSYYSQLLLLLPAAFYQYTLLPITSHCVQSLPTASYHSPLCPIIPYCFLSLPAASYPSAPLPITFDGVLLLPTASYHSPPLSLPVPCFL